MRHATCVHACTTSAIKLSLDHHDSYIVALAVAVAAAVVVVVGMLGCIAQFGHFESKIVFELLVGSPGRLE